jgi:hypothetical protein
MAMKSTAGRTRTTFTFAKASVAARVERIAGERGCSIQEIINEAVEEYVRADPDSIRTICSDLVLQQGKLIAIIERGGGHAATGTQQRIATTPMLAPPIPPPTMMSGIAAPISEWEIPTRNAWE